MGIFSKRKGSEQSSSQPVGQLGAGRRLRSERSIAESLETLSEVIASYRPQKYEHLPHFVDCGYVWQAEPPAPQRAICCNDENQDFVLVTLWPIDGGSQAGLFELGGTGSSSTIIGHWKARDRSLTSIGTVPGGSVALRAPEIPGDFAEHILRTAGYPPTPRNLTATEEMIAQQFLVKAHQFISSQSRPDADRFVAAHRPAGELRTILNDLAAWNPGVLPYIQDLPMRVRAIMLEPDMHSSSDFWAGLER